MTIAGHRFLAAIIQQATGLPPLRTAVVYPCDKPSLIATVMGRDSGLIVPVLVGPRVPIQACAATAGLDITDIEIVDTPADAAKAAEVAVEICVDHRADALIKGGLHTHELAGAVINSALRTPRKVSHAVLVDMPGFSRLLIVTDTGVNIAPDAATKRDIILNAVDLAHALGIAEPKVAILSALETVDPQIPSTLDALELKKMAALGAFPGALLEGPLALDLALSPEAASIKRIASPVAGHADILVAPGLESGNLFYKMAVYLGRAETAGIILGARVPVIVTSRTSSVNSRIASCAMAVLYARYAALRSVASMA